MQNSKHNKLKEIRTSRKLTIKEVVEGTGIPMRTYQNYEYCEREIGATALSKLADFYHVTTDYLLGRESSETDTFDQLTNEFNMTTLERQIVENYFSLPESIRNDLMGFLQRTVEEVQQKNGK